MSREDLQVMARGEMLLHDSLAVTAYLGARSSPAPCTAPSASTARR
jgi:hypothetical protein